MHSADGDLTPEAAGALAVLHARYAGDIQKHVRRLLSDDKEAEDVTRAVFVRASEELALGGRAPASLRSWILSIAQQEALNRGRAAPVVQASAAPADAPSRSWRADPRPSAAPSNRPSTARFTASESVTVDRPRP